MSPSECCVSEIVTPIARVLKASVAHRYFAGECLLWHIREYSSGSRVVAVGNVASNEQQHRLTFAVHAKDLVTRLAKHELLRRVSRALGDDVTPLTRHEVEQLVD